MNEQVPSLCNRIDSKKPFSSLAFVIIILFFIGILILLFLRSPFITINKIEVKGNHLLTTENILNRLPDLKGTSFFSVNVVQLRKSLLSFPEIKNVEVNRGFPNKLYITLSEKKIIGFMSSGYQYYPVFENGLFTKKKYFNLDMYDKPILEGWRLPNNTFHATCINLSRLPKSVIYQIIRIKPVVGESDQVEILTRKHHRIFIRANGLSEKIRIYLSFLKKPPGKLYLLESVWYKPEKYSS